MTMATEVGKINRGKAFKVAFDRVETVHGKAVLTDDTKKAIRNEIDDRLKTMATLSKSEVVRSITPYKRVTADLELEEGKRIVATETAKKTTEEEVLSIHGLLFELYGKIARSENGMTDGQERQIRRLKNAINSRLFALQTDGTLNDQMQRISAYVNKREVENAKQAIEQKLTTA